MCRVLGFRFKKEIRCLEGFLVRFWNKIEAKVGSFREKTRIPAISQVVVKLCTFEVSHTINIQL